MTEAVRGHMLRPERWHRSRCGRHVSGKLEPDARCPKRLTIPVDEHRFIRCPWLPLQQLLQEKDGLRPERADAFLAALAKDRTQLGASNRIDSEHRSSASWIRAPLL